jgi:hypothetical protein
VKLTAREPIRPSITAFAGELPRFPTIARIWTVAGHVGHESSGRADTLVKSSRSDFSQVDLAEDARIVPPAADVAAVRPDRHVGYVQFAAAAVDPHDEDIRVAGPGMRGGHLERQVAAGVAADPAAVQPGGRAVIDGLEAQDPARGRARRRQLEVLSIPPDAAEVAVWRVVARVGGVRNRRRLPADGALPALPAKLLAAIVWVGAPVPGPGDQVAAGGAILVEGAGRGSIRADRGDSDHARDRAERNHCRGCNSCSSDAQGRQP